MPPMFLEKGQEKLVTAMQEKCGEKDLSVMTIGQAGENLVRFAGFINEHDRSAGRSGTGAVAGYKNLKAIMEGGLTTPRKGGLSVYGTNLLANLINEVGALPIRNSQETQGDEAEKHSGE